MSVLLRKPALPVVLLLCWLATSTVANAADAGIIDNAKMFSADAIRKVDDSLRELKTKTNKTVVIETHRGIPADQRAAFRANRPAFYSKWVESQAKALKLNGSLFMIVQETKEDVGDAGAPGFRIEFWTDADTRKQFTNQEADAATAKLKKLFKDDRNQALLDMTASIKSGMMSRFVAASPLGAAAEKGVIKNHTPVNKPADANNKEGMDVTMIVIYIIGGLIGFWILIGLVRAFTRPRVQPGDYNAPPPPPGGYRGGMAPPPPPGYGQPYGGQPMGYAQPQQAGGMGFMGSLMTGMLGAAAGNFMYDRFFRGGSHGGDYGGYGGSSASTGGGYFGGGNSGSGEPQTGYTGGSDIPMDDTGTAPSNDYDQDMTGGGGDFGGGSSGGDFGGGGGDFGGGGGDFGGGGGDFSGGGSDFSGGDSGGGDF